MNRPFRSKLLVDEAERFATAEKGDIIVIKGSFFQDLAFRCGFRTGVGCVDRAGADGPLATIR